MKKYILLISRYDGDRYWFTSDSYVDILETANRYRSFDDVIEVHLIEYQKCNVPVAVEGRK